LRHRIARIRRKVHQDLFHLYRVNAYRAEPLPRDETERDVFSD
jgi:hypothetical protein